jgi:YHS domain-containing protein
MRFLLRVLVIFFLVMAALSAIRRLLAPMFDRGRPAASGRTPDGSRSPASTGKLVADPVCGTYIAAATAPTLTRGDDVFYFCSEECRGKFEKRG